MEEEEDELEEGEQPLLMVQEDEAEQEDSGDYGEEMGEGDETNIQDDEQEDMSETEAIPAE